MDEAFSPLRDAIDTIMETIFDLEDDILRSPEGEALIASINVLIDSVNELVECRTALREIIKSVYSVHSKLSQDINKNPHIPKTSKKYDYDYEYKGEYERGYSQTPAWDTSIALRRLRELAAKFEKQYVS